MELKLVGPLKERWEAEHRLRTAIAQRCTNEAEARKKALAEGRERLARDERWHDFDRRAEAIVGQVPVDGPELNREQRRRLAAVQRKAA